MHVLAYFYHWSRLDLWVIPRLERKKWVEMVKMQIKAENKNNKGEDEDELDE